MSRSTGRSPPLGAAEPGPLVRAASRAAELGHQGLELLQELFDAERPGLLGRARALGPAGLTRAAGLLTAPRANRLATTSGLAGTLGATALFASLGTFGVAALPGGLRRFEGVFHREATGALPAA